MSDRSTVTLLVTGTSVLAVLAGNCSFASEPGPHPLGTGYPDIVGNIVNYTYEDFSSFQWDVQEDGIRWHGTTGYFKDVTRKVHPQVSRVSDGVYFSSWPTAQGGGDNVVHNFNDMKVYAHLYSPAREALQILFGEVHCRNTPECTYPNRGGSLTDNALPIVLRNIEEQALPRLYDPASNNRPQIDAHSAARNELRGVAILYESDEGLVRLEVDGESTRVRRNGDETDVFQTYATKVASGIYFISWRQGKGGSHIVVNRNSRSVFDHITSDGQRRERVFELICESSDHGC